MTRPSTWSLDPTDKAVLERIARALEQLAGIETKEASPARRRKARTDDAATRVKELSRRLGRGNQEFLFHLALKFGDDYVFTLSEASEGWHEPVASLRARMRNIARATGSMGERAPDLFTREWDNDERCMKYEMDPDARRAILGMRTR